MKKKLSAQGFTLVELIVAIAIVALIITIALPSYENSVQKARRAQAQTQLLEFANTAERFFTEQGTYANAPLPTGTDEVFDYYTFSFTSGPSASGYTLAAAPKSAQATDKCGTMSLDHTGAKFNNGTVPECWGTTISS